VDLYRGENAKWNSRLGRVSGGILYRTQEMHNRVVLSGRNLLRDAMFGFPAVQPLFYFVAGTASAIPSDEDVALGNEIHRDVLTSRTPGPATLVVKYFLSPLSLNGQIIREAGLLTCNNILYSRVVLREYIEKNAAIAGLFSWTLTWEAKV
jgi:hypothetical protein